MSNTYRCSCTKCQPMPTVKQNACCQFYANIRQLTTAADVKCITDMSLFKDNCLNRNVLETSRFEYIHREGPFGDADQLNELFSYKTNNILKICIHNKTAVFNFKPVVCWGMLVNASSSVNIINK